MRYGKIKPVDVANGEGIRVSLFVSGCPHKCKGCFNSELWDYDAGDVFTINAFERVLTLCGKDYISGLSLLGGEPLAPENRVDVWELCGWFKRIYPEKTIWLYTGYVWEEICELPVMDYIDVLVDGRFVEGLSDPRLRFRGSSNQRIIDVEQSQDRGYAVQIDDFM
jgi:anaerobic ribonucleoside-triphosphate reductase activating protein